MLCAGLSDRCLRGGSSLMLSASRWHRSRLVRASVAVGLAIVGVLLVWAALARPSTPGSALAGAPNGHSMPSTSPSAPEPTSGRPTVRADQTGVRDKVTGLVLPESDPVEVSIPRIGVRSRSVSYTHLTLPTTPYV